jgi:uncharacterized protein YqhQ
MRGVASWALAVRTSAGGLAVRSFPLRSARARHRVLRLPVVRGVAALAESVALGAQAVGVAADARRAEGARPAARRVSASTLALGGLALAACLLLVLPAVVVSGVGDRLAPVPAWLLEGVLRLVLLVATLLVASRRRALARLFAYHGAEHKAVAAYEAGDALLPERAARHPRLHPRCGTSLLLVVVVLAVPLLAPLGLLAPHWLVLSRLLAVPLLAGLAFEVLRWAGRHPRSPWVRAVVSPGLWLQRTTTREPDSAQLAVALAALEAVLEREEPRVAAGEERRGLRAMAQG